MIKNLFQPFRFFYVCTFLLTGMILMYVLLEPGVADPKSAGLFGLWINFLGTLHPVFLHLPIGALLLVVLLEALAVFSGGRFRPPATVALGFTLFGALLAFFFGYCLYLNGSYAGELIDKHKQEALVFCVLLSITFLLKITDEKWAEKSNVLHRAYLVSLLLTVAVMGSAGHHGGMITHGDPMEKLPMAVLAKRAEAAEAMRGDPIVYQHIVHPILEERCVYCHGAEKQEGHYRMDSYAALLIAGDTATGLVPGDTENSGIISRMHLPHNDEHHMPPSDKPQLTREERVLLEWWVSQGAPEHSTLSQLEITPDIEEVLASLVSPAERKERDLARKKEEQQARKQMRAAKHELEPKIAAFNTEFPDAVNYISSKKADLRFNGISYTKTFGREDLEKLLPFADYLHSINLSLSNIDDQSAGVISQFKQLRELNVSQTSVSDAFVAGLTNLQNLALLNLFGTRVTPAARESLESFPALNTLFLGSTAFDADQTKAIRHALTRNREVPVEVIGMDQMPNLAMLSEEGAFIHKISSDPATYGESIGSRARVTLSSDEAKYSPPRGWEKFMAQDDPGLEFTFHSKNEKNPWVQLSFDHPHRINAFFLRNRENLPHRADGLELQRLRPDGSWERIWTAPSPLKVWPGDLTEVPEEKRVSTAFRFIISKEEAAILHLAHLSLWGNKLDSGPAVPVELGDQLDIAGQGEWTYVVAPHWGHLPDQKEIGPTHGGVVVDQAGQVYVSTDGPNGILVYRRDGTYLTSIAKDQGRYHGLCIHSERGQEFIYAAGYDHVAKYTLSGEQILKIEGARQAEGQTWGKATAVAVAPGGELFVADGYGSCVIFKYNLQGQFLKKFGARGNANGQFITSHGITVDSRNPDRPLLIVCDRENGRLQHFDLEGNFVKIAIQGLRRPCSVAIWKDLLLVAELAGRAVLLDDEYKIVSILGDNPREDERANFHVHPDAWEEGVFTAPHGCSFDHQGNIYIQDWNKWGRVTKLLNRKLLTPEDVTRLVALKEQGELLHAVQRSDSGWTPGQLEGLALWLDADDLSTLTVSSGKVSQWDDKSSSRFHAYALNPNTPPSLAGNRINGRSALKLQRSRLASKVPEQGNWRDVFVVAQWTGGPKFNNFNGLLTGFGGSLGIIGDSRGVGTGVYIPETWWNTLRINGQVNDGSDVISILSSPFMASITADKKTDVTGFSIGSDREFVYRSNARFWDGLVCEIIGFNRPLTDAEREQVEGYLAHKWGLVPALTAAHPYKKRVP